MPDEASFAKLRPCVLGHYATAKACTSAYFDATGTRILSASYDDRLRGEHSDCNFVSIKLNLLSYIPVFEIDPNNIKSIPEDLQPITTMKVN